MEVLAGIYLHAHSLLNTPIPLLCPTKQQRAENRQRRRHSKDTCPGILAVHLVEGKYKLPLGGTRQEMPLEGAAMENKQSSLKSYETGESRDI